MSFWASEEMTGFIGMVDHKIVQLTLVGEEVIDKNSVNQKNLTGKEVKG